MNGDKGISKKLGAKLALTLLALAELCACVTAQENTTDYWMDKAEEFAYNSSFYLVISALV
jgi:hypothetical protein